VRSPARLESLQKLFGDRKAYLCDVEFPEQIAALAKDVGTDYGPTGWDRTFDRLCQLLGRFQTLS
jgi:hypothetical protein